jgi:hypothetical protein
MTLANSTGGKWNKKSGVLRFDSVSLSKWFPVLRNTPPSMSSTQGPSDKHGRIQSKVFVCHDYFEEPREPSTISLSTVELITDVERCTATVKQKI